MISLFEVVRRPASPTTDGEIKWAEIGDRVPVADFPRALSQRLDSGVTDHPHVLQLQKRAGPIWTGESELASVRDTFRALILDAPDADGFVNSGAISKADAIKFVDWSDAVSGGSLPVEAGYRGSRGGKRYRFVRAWAARYLEYLERPESAQRAFPTRDVDGRMLVDFRTTSPLFQMQLKRYAPASRNRGSPDHTGGFNPVSLAMHSRIALAISRGEISPVKVAAWTEPKLGYYAVGYKRIQGLNGSKVLFMLADYGGGAQRAEAISGYCARLRGINGIPSWSSLPYRRLVGWFFGLTRRSRHHAVQPNTVMGNLHPAFARCRSGDYSGFDTTVSAEVQLAVSDAMFEHARRTSGGWLGDAYLRSIAPLAEMYAWCPVLHGRAFIGDGGFMQRGGDALRSGTPDTSLQGNVYNASVHYAYACGARSIDDLPTDRMCSRGEKRLAESRDVFSIAGDDTVNSFDDGFKGLVAELGQVFDYLDGVDFLKTIYRLEKDGRSASTVGHLGSVAINRCFKEERFLPEDVALPNGRVLATAEQVAAMSYLVARQRLSASKDWTGRLDQLMAEGCETSRRIFRISTDKALLEHLGEVLKLRPDWADRGGLFPADYDSDPTLESPVPGTAQTFDWETAGEAAARNYTVGEAIQVLHNLRR